MYVLDSNTFIDAKNRYYGFDIVPSFWNKLIENSPENILTIKPIEDEIMAGHDELSSWFQDNYTVHAYASDSAEIQQVFARISNYVRFLLGFLIMLQRILNTKTRRRLIFYLRPILGLLHTHM